MFILIKQLFQFILIFYRYSQSSLKTLQVSIWSFLWVKLCKYFFWVELLFSLAEIITILMLVCIRLSCRKLVKPIVCCFLRSLYLPTLCSRWLWDWSPPPQVEPQTCSRTRFGNLGLRPTTPRRLPRIMWVTVVQLFLWQLLSTQELSYSKQCLRWCSNDVTVKVTKWCKGLSLLWKWNC